MKRSLTFAAICALSLTSATAMSQDYDIEAHKTDIVDIKTTPTPSQANLQGMRGLLRVQSAIGQPKGTVSIGTNVQFFTVKNFLPGRVSGKTDHSHLSNSYTLSWTPLSFLEAAMAIHISSDNSTNDADDELQVTIGDPELTVKGYWEPLPNLAFGALVDTQILSGSGFFSSNNAAFRLTLAALSSWTGTAKVPVNIHLNLGFLIDGSEDLFSDLGEYSPTQLYAAQISSFHRFIGRLGVSYTTQYVSPFVEFSTEPFVGSGAPGFADSPTYLSFGVHAWPTKTRGLELMAAADIGLTGVGDGETNEMPDTYAFVIPRWNVALRLSYRFDPFITESSAGKTTTAVAANTPQACPSVETVVKVGRVSGTVVDAETLKPIWNAHVEILSDSASPLAVDPQQGTFLSFPIPLGTATVRAAAEGYLDTRVLLDVGAQGTKTVIQLSKKKELQPGTLRGTVTKRGGGRIASATILIPELDRTLKAESDGSFRIDIKPGQYTLVVSAPHHRAQEKRIRVVEGGTVILNVELYR